VFGKALDLPNGVLFPGSLDGSAEEEQKDFLQLHNAAVLTRRGDVDGVGWTEKDELTEVIFEVSLELLEDAGEGLDTGLGL